MREPRGAEASGSSQRLSPVSASAAAAVALLAVPALADVEVGAEITAGISRTDNITLVSENAEAETVFELSPSFNLSQNSTRLTSNVAVQLQAYYFEGRSDSDVFQQMNGDVSFALDPENFFFDFGASRSQTVRDPELPIPRSNLPISNNRLDRDEAFLGPRFQYALGSNVIVSGSWRRNYVRFEEDLQFGGVGGFRRDFDGDTVNFAINNYSRERGVSWALRYNGQKTDYGEFQPWEYRQATAELGGWVGGGLRLFAAGGKESAWDAPFDPSLEDDFWEVGFAKLVGERFNAEVAVGERSFGDSGRASLTWNGERASSVMSYSEQPTTQGRNPFERGGLLGPEIPQDFLTRIGTAERFIAKRFQWRWNIALRRTTFSLSVFDETREGRTTFDGTPIGDEEQSGATFNATWQAGARTDVNFSASRIDRTFIGTGERELELVSIGAGYALGPRTRLGLDYSYAEEASPSGQSGLDYTANLISLRVTRSF